MRELRGESAEDLIKAGIANSSVPLQRLRQSRLLTEKRDRGRLGKRQNNQWVLETFKAKGEEPRDRKAPNIHTQTEKEKNDEQLKYVVVCWSRLSPDKTDTSLPMQICQRCSVANHVLLQKRCVNLKR